MTDRGPAAGERIGSQRALTRRQALTAFAAGGAGLAIPGLPASAEPAQAAEPTSDEAVPFYGPVQGGILTPKQRFTQVAAFDFEGRSAAELRTLMRRWTTAAARMCRGEPPRPLSGDRHQPPLDSGEAAELGAQRLTITFGFGPGLFERGRAGLHRRRPTPLQELPPFEREVLDPARSGGDLCVQACADDATVAFHAVRSLARIASPARLRWRQSGFTAMPPGGSTSRNLLGFKDGTNNILADEGDALAEFVFVGSDERKAWMSGGTYMVCRRIRMLLGTWDRTDLAKQEQVIGRHKLSGAPIGSGNEHDPVDLLAERPDGSSVIPPGSHIRVAAPSTNDGVRLLRRGYSFDDGLLRGKPDAGLFFIAFQRDPRLGFVEIQRNLSGSDYMNEFIRHNASALFAIPPGAETGGFVGEGLL